MTKQGLLNLKLIISEICVLSLLVSFLTLLIFFKLPVQLGFLIFAGGSLYAALRMYVLPILSIGLNEEKTKETFFKERYLNVKSKNPEEEIYMMTCKERNRLISKVSLLKDENEKLVRKLSESNSQLRILKENSAENKKILAQSEEQKHNSLKEKALLIEEKKELEANYIALKNKFLALKRSMVDSDRRVKKSVKENEKLDFEKLKTSLSLLNDAQKRFFGEADQKLLLNLKKLKDIEMKQKSIKEVVFDKKSQGNTNPFEKLVKELVFESISLLPKAAGNQWKLKPEYCQEISYLLDENTIIVGSFILYLLYKQYDIPAIGFEEADIDLITRLTPAVWQEKYQQIGVNVVKLWSRNGITCCKAIFRTRNLDVVFVNVNSEIELVMWVDKDVTLRPDNSASVFYGIKYEDNIIAYDPSREGMRSIVTNSIKALGNDNYAIKRMLEENPCRLLRLVMAAAKFNLTIEKNTLDEIAKLSNDKAFVQMINCGWVIAKHKKYLNSTAGREYNSIFSSLDRNCAFFSESLSRNRGTNKASEKTYESCFFKLNSFGDIDKSQTPSCDQCKAIDLSW